MTNPDYLMCLIEQTGKNQAISQVRLGGVKESEG